MLPVNTNYRIYLIYPIDCPTFSDYFALLCAISFHFALFRRSLIPQKGLHWMHLTFAQFTSVCYCGFHMSVDQSDICLFDTKTNGRNQRQVINNHWKCQKIIPSSLDVKHLNLTFWDVLKCLSSKVDESEGVCQMHQIQVWCDQQELCSNQNICPKQMI